MKNHNMSFNFWNWEKFFNEKLWMKNYITYHTGSFVASPFGISIPNTFSSIKYKKYRIYQAGRWPKSDQGHEGCGSVVDKIQSDNFSDAINTRFHTVGLAPILPVPNLILSKLIALIFKKILIILFWNFFFI